MVETSLPPEPMPEAKAAIKRRIESQGIYREFCIRRDKLKGKGVDVYTAWRQAAIEVEEEHQQRLENSDTDVQASLYEPDNRENYKYQDLPDIPIEHLEEINRGQPNRSKAISWVTSHLYVSGLEFSHVLKELDAPTAALAWTFLKYAKRDKSSEQDFLKTIAPRVLMVKSDLEKEDRFEDDGRDVIAIIDRIERARQNAVLPLSP